MSEFYTNNLKIIHKYFCYGVYHPVFWSVVAIVATFVVNFSQLFHLIVYGNAEFLFVGGMYGGDGFDSVPHDL